MIIDHHEIARQLRDLEDKIRDLRRSLEGGRPVFDALSGLTTSDRVDLPAGYTVLSPGLGLFLFDGAAQARVIPSGTSHSLQITGADTQGDPTGLIVQLNLLYQIMRGRTRFMVEADWTGGDGAVPTFEIRLIGVNGMLKRAAIDAETYPDATGGTLRAPIEISTSLSRSDSLHEMQFCLSFDRRVLGAEFTVLRVV